MSDGILFIVLPERSAANVQAMIRRVIVPDKREFVQIFTDAGASTLTTNVKSQTAQDLIARISAYPRHDDNRLIVGHEVQCNIAELTNWWNINTFGKRRAQKLALPAVARTVKEHLEKIGWHWRIHAQTELRKFDGPPCNLEAWVQQFGKFDCPSIGSKIAAKLRVIRTGQLTGGAFVIRPTDLIGHRQGRCYVQDDDPGGSWLEMQALLTHAYPPAMVFPIHWDKKLEQLHFPETSVDEFVIYEDGLWSGREAVRRLHAIKKEPPPATVTFRFGIVTDFGLMVARQAIRSLGLSGRVSIDASASEIIRFLKQDIPEILNLGLEMPPETYFAELQQLVQPFAFNLSEDWTTEEIRICEEIGAQLVHNWLSHHTTEAPLPDKIERFALGGGRFASTVVFSRSVPKVCLPLLWLDGLVELRGERLSWKPLFVDARRVWDGSL